MSPNVVVATTNSKVAKERQALFFTQIKEYKTRKEDFDKRLENMAKENPHENPEALEQRLQRALPTRKQMFAVQDFQVGLQIGQGSFAIVKRVTHKKSGHLVALKIYEKKNLQKQIASLSLHREIYVLASIYHQNIMRLYEVVDSRTHVHLVMELCHGKSLYHFVKKRKPDGRIPEAEAAPIFKQIVSAVAYMHSLNVVHRDLKLDNILINDSREVKLIDFGFSSGAAPDEKLPSQCGTP